MPNNKYQAPSAKQFFEAKNENNQNMDFLQYMNFAELYADFIIEFEKKNGDLRLCGQWPTTRVGRMVDY